MIKYFFIGIIFLIGLAYIAWPAPKTVESIPVLPISLKSDEPGDTYQNPNIAGYYSDYWRDFVTSFYREKFSYLEVFGFKVPVIRLNHPPEEAYQYIRDQQRSTYLEQYIYPLRGSLFVNGYEPISQSGKKFDGISVPIEKEGQIFNSKTTIRYYPSPLKFRLLNYFGIWLALFLLYQIFQESLRKKYE